MGKFILSAFADEYSRELDVQLKMLAENGFPLLEPRFIGEKNIADLTADEVTEMKKALDDAGIGVSSIGSPLGKISLDDNIETHLELSRRVFETACILGAKNIRMFSFYPHKGRSISEDSAEVFDKLGMMLDIAETMGVTLCHENEAEIYGETPEACLEMLSHFGGRLRAVFDMGNFVWCGIDPMAAYELLKDHIEYFHIKDALGLGQIVPAGLGKAKIGEILKAYMKEYNRDVIITLEPHLEVFDGLNSLTGAKFDNPYKFESKEEAFITAIEKLREVIA